MARLPDDFEMLDFDSPQRRIDQIAPIHDGLVAKLGPRKSLATGKVSASQFSLFNLEEHRGQPSLDWVVIGARDTLSFAGRGDSGAWVFDTEGRLVGMVVGSGVGPLIDRTSGSCVHPEDEWNYITPVEPLFQDIERQTGCRVRLPGDDREPDEFWV
jgi:hypothetical protein